MNRLMIWITQICLALLLCGVAAAADDDATVAYFQSPAFNVPLLAGWQDQSGEDFAQFHLPAAGATIRTTLVAQSDSKTAAEADLSAAYGIAVDAPLYADKVNLADGTWTVLVYQVDADTSASVMARKVDAQSVVVSLVERDAATQLMTLAMTRSDETAADAANEIALALDALSLGAVDPDSRETLELGSGAWLRLGGGAVTALGMVFGNDSYIALADGESEALPQVADAWNTTLLGFFITPDNSAYLALGLAGVFAILALLILSIIWRFRNAAQDLALIQSLGAEDQER